ncbi:MAG: Nif3-like dinuclear metal center hexameric protein, partial [Oscillospiraceae bacterium]|nr:Nif3-like dinuclear metal center hexameric protein [Oscillospiraceae bacterium]
MPTVREIESALYELAPRELAMEWDNVGLLVGSPDREVGRVLVALDVTES